MPTRLDFHGRSAPALPVEVLAVIEDTASYAGFERFPGAQDVIVCRTDGAQALPRVDRAWWLVSPHGHRVAAVSVLTGTTSDASDEGFEIHLAVGESDAWLVHAGRGWLLEPTELADDDGIEGLLVRMTEPTRDRTGITLYFAIDQAWAPLVRGATQLALTDVPGRPCGIVERCVEDAEPGQAPQMVVDLHLTVDPVLTVGAVYRLQPRLLPPLRLIMS